MKSKYISIDLGSYNKKEAITWLKEHCTYVKNVREGDNSHLTFKFACFDEGKTASWDITRMDAYWFVTNYSEHNIDKYSAIDELRIVCDGDGYDCKYTITTTVYHG